MKAWDRLRWRPNGHFIVGPTLQKTVRESLQKNSGPQTKPTRRAKNVRPSLGFNGTTQKNWAKFKTRKDCKFVEISDTLATRPTWDEQASPAPKLHPYWVKQAEAQPLKSHRHPATAGNGHRSVPTGVKHQGKAISTCHRRNWQSSRTRKVKTAHALLQRIRTHRRYPFQLFQRARMPTIHTQRVCSSGVRAVRKTGLRSCHATA